MILQIVIGSLIVAPIACWYLEKIGTFIGGVVMATMMYLSSPNRSPKKKPEE